MDGVHDFIDEGRSDGHAYVIRASLGIGAAEYRHRP